MLRRLRHATLAIAALASLTALRGDDYVSPAAARLKADVTYLADDLREGRGPGTKGLDHAADYIAQVFREAGLKTADGAEGYFQPFSLRGEARIGEASKLAAKTKGSTYTGRLRDDFMPLAVGSRGKVEGVPLVFVGYGITAKDEDKKLDYDDYKDLDVTGKAVLIIRREPQQNKDDSPFDGKTNSTFATFGHKVTNAAKRGARAVLLVNDAAGTAGGTKDELLDYAAAGGAAVGIPVVMVTRDFADKLMRAAGQPSLKELEEKIDEDLKPQSRALEGVEVGAEVAIDREPLKVKNVIGVLEGSGPLAHETIVIGAHYDHLGFGGAGSMAFGQRAIHNGADDNASGTATVLEMARRLAKRPEPLPRRIVFMLFSAEELGLIGSAYYCSHPLYPLKDTVAMINFDMVGRLNKEEHVLIYGAGTSPNFEKLVEVLCDSQGLKAKMVPGTSGEFSASDHASFYAKDIPVVFFFTGLHGEYHRPSDDSHLINYTGMARIADAGELLLLDLARRPDRPRFIKLSNRSSGLLIGLGGADNPHDPKNLGTPTRITADPSKGATPKQGSGPSGAYLGGRPAYGDTPEDGGVKIEGISEGSPAEKAGMKAGDILIKLGDYAIADLNGYQAALNAHKPGDSLEAVVKRDGKDVTLKVKLSTRPGRAPKE